MAKGRKTPRDASEVLKARISYLEKTVLNLERKQSRYEEMDAALRS